MICIINIIKAPKKSNLKTRITISAVKFDDKKLQFIMINGLVIRNKMKIQNQKF